MESSLTSKQWEFEQWYIQEKNCEDRLSGHEWAYPFVDLPKAYVFCSCGSQSSDETLYLCLVSLRVRLRDGEKVRGVWRYKGHNRFLIRRGLISMGFYPEGRSVFIPSYI